MAGRQKEKHTSSMWQVCLCTGLLSEEKTPMSKHLLFLPSAKYNCSSKPGLASEHRLPGMSARCSRKEKQLIQGPRKREYQRSSKPGYRKHLCAQTQVTMVPIRLELTWPYQKAATNFQGCSYWGELQPVAVGQEQTMSLQLICVEHPEQSDT